MAIEFNTVEFKGTSIQAVKISDENISELAVSLNGKIDDGGMLSFTLSNHELFAYVGDWLILFDRGRDALTFSDKMFQRLFKSV